VLANELNGLTEMIYMSWKHLRFTNQQATGYMVYIFKLVHRAPKLL